MSTTAPATHPVPSDDSRASQHRTKLPERNLDVLRAVAVLMVLTDHVISAAGVHVARGWNWNWALGRFGVLLFFVHTALVLMSSLERSGQDSGWVRRFYVRRAFRIYPLAMLAVVIVTALHLPPRVTWDGSDMSRAFPGFRVVCANLALVQNLVNAPNVLGVLWSLPLEVQMYVALPACYLITQIRPTRFALFIGAVVLLGLAFVSPLGGAVPGLWRLSILGFAPCFCGGLVAYHLLRTGARPLAPSAAFPFVLAGAAGLFVLLHPDASHLAAGWLPCLALGAALPWIAELPASWITRVAHLVAKYSYGIYLAHVPLLWYWVRHVSGLGGVERWVAFALSCAVVPVALYHAVEAPLIRCGTAVARSMSPAKPSTFTPAPAAVT